MITLKKSIVHLVTSIIPFCTEYIESLLTLSKYEDTAQTMSNEELSKAVEKELIQDAYLMARLPELQKQMKLEMESNLPNETQ